MKKLIALICCVVITLIFAVGCNQKPVEQTADTSSPEGWNYSEHLDKWGLIQEYEGGKYSLNFIALDEETCALIGYSGELPKVFKIPEETDYGRTVVELHTSYILALHDNQPNVEEMYIPETVTRIGDGVFYGLENLHTLSLGSKLEYIDMENFSDAPLKRIIIENNPYYELVEGKFFVDKRTDTLLKGLDGGKIPDNIKTIGYYAFDNIEISEIVIPDGVETIEFAAFGGGDMQEIEFPSSVTFIGAYVLAGSSVKSVSGGSYTVIHKSAFQKTEIESFVVPSGVTAIYQHAFWDCPNLRYVYIPKSVTTIDHAFCGLKDCTIVFEADSLSEGIGEYWLYESENCKVIFGGSFDN